jgi:hypothetical protein
MKRWDGEPATAVDFLGEVDTEHGPMAVVRVPGNKLELVHSSRLTDEDGRGLYYLLHPETP